MKSIVIVILGTLLCSALAEPLRYRPAQQVRASARQTNAGVAVQAELGENAPEAKDDQGTQSDEAVTEPPFTLSAPAPGGPYYPQGWRPFGQLLVLPVAVRQNLESTTPVESSTLSDSDTKTETETESTEQTPTTEAQATNGQLQEVETSEPKEKKFAAHKRPTIVIIKGKKIGELRLEAKEETKTELNEGTTEANTTDSSTTENDDDETTTEPKSENLETTSEPNSEAVDPEKDNEDGKQLTNPQEANQPQLPPVPQNGFFVQLQDGSFQRIVYFPQQTPVAFVPQQAPTQSQQLNEAPNYPFGFNPITNPRIVTFSTQYNAW